MKNIGTRLKNAINNSIYSQIDIADKLNISKDTISNYINNKSIPRLDIFIKICDIIDVPIQNIVYGIENSNIDNILFNKINNLDDKQKEKVIDYIEFLESKVKQKSSNLSIIEGLEKGKNDTG